MKHRIGYNRLGRKASHRKALIKNMVTQLYRHERIRTTKSKALEVRRKAEKLITKAKEDTLHNRRTIAKLIQDKEILAKLFTDIAPSFATRPGGYTRILKLGYRKGDAAEMVILELVEREEDFEPRKKAKKEPEPEAKPEPEEALEEPAEADEPAADDGEEEETADEATEEAEASAEPEETADTAEETPEPEEEGASKEG